MLDTVSWFLSSCPAIIDTRSRMVCLSEFGEEAPFFARRRGIWPPKQAKLKTSRRDTRYSVSLRRAGAGMDEFLPGWRKLLELRAGSLSQNRVAGVSVVRLNCAPSVGGLVFAIMTAETARPCLVTDVVGVDFPVRAYFRE